MRALPARIAFLGALYLVQGLPLGVQATALPVLLRRLGVSIESIGFVSALAVPWMIKLLWAPWIDAFFSRRIGRRRTWILPLQLALAAACGAAAFVDPSRQLGVLLVLLLAMNFFAATMDVPVDGWAVDLLRANELGPGNAAQVVGFKLGMIATGGVLFSMVRQIGWHGLFGAMAAIVMLVFTITVLVDEPGMPTRANVSGGVREVFSAIVDVARRPGMLWVLAFIATYKIGESAADTMFKPFLVDAGYDDHQIGSWVGTWGMAASIAGSLFGGVLAARAPVLSALVVTAVLRTIPILGQLALAHYGTTDDAVIAVTMGEHACGGALTTVMFAFMMSQVDLRIGATHYTALATVEVLGKSPAALLSGVLQRQIGYAGVFGAAFVLSLAFLLFLIPLRRSTPA